MHTENVTKFINYSENIKLLCYTYPTQTQSLHIQSAARLVGMNSTIGLTACLFIPLMYYLK